MAALKDKLSPRKLVHAHYTCKKHEEGREPRARIAWASVTRTVRRLGRGGGQRQKDNNAVIIRKANTGANVVWPVRKWNCLAGRP